MASITQGPITPAPTLTPLPLNWSAAHLQTPWGNYQVTVLFQNRIGKIGVPLGKASPTTGPTAAIIDLHAPYCVKIVDFVATRVDASPVLPSRTSPDANLELLSADFWPHVPELQADGISYQYGGTGRYIYQCLEPVTEDTGFPLTFPPYEQESSKTSLDSDDFDEDIVK